MPIVPAPLPIEIFSGGAFIPTGFLEQYINQITSEVLPVTKSIVEDYQLKIEDQTIFVDTTAGDVTVTMITAVGNGGREFKFSKRDDSENSLIIEGFGSETINGELNASISAQYDSFHLISSGIEWGVF